MDSPRDELCRHCRSNATVARHASCTKPRMFEPTLPPRQRRADAPERLRRMQQEAAHAWSIDAGTTRLTSLNATLLQDLSVSTPPPDGATGLEALEVLAAAVRHGARCCCTCNTATASSRYRLSADGTLHCRLPLQQLLAWNWATCACCTSSPRGCARWAAAKPPVSASPPLRPAEPAVVGAGPARCTRRPAARDRRPGGLPRGAGRHCTCWAWAVAGSSGGPFAASGLQRGRDRLLAWLRSRARDAFAQRPVPARGADGQPHAPGGDQRGLDGGRLLMPAPGSPAQGRVAGVAQHASTRVARCRGSGGSGAPGKLAR